MSWLSKQFKSFKKHVVPREIRKVFTEIGQAVPNEITGFWDDAIKGSTQIADALGFGSVAQLGGYDSVQTAAGYGDKKAAPAAPALTTDSGNVLGARNMERRRAYRAQGRSSTIRTGATSPYSGTPKQLLGS